jgi:hypothetical protein
MSRNGRQRLLLRAIIHFFRQLRHREVDEETPISSSMIFLDPARTSGVYSDRPREVESDAEPRQRPNHQPLDDLVPNSPRRVQRTRN